MTILDIVNSCQYFSITNLTNKAKSNYYPDINLYKKFNIISENQSKEMIDSIYMDLGTYFNCTIFNLDASFFTIIQQMEKYHLKTIFEYKDNDKGQIKGDFNKFNLKNIREYPNGTIVGDLENGITINVRMNSSEGYPTLEIQGTDALKSIKIRY